MWTSHTHSRSDPLTHTMPSFSTECICVRLWVPVCWRSPVTKLLPFMCHAHERRVSTERRQRTGDEQLANWPNRLTSSTNPTANWNRFGALSENRRQAHTKRKQIDKMKKKMCLLVQSDCRLILLQFSMWKWSFLLGTTNTKLLLPFQFAEPKINRSTHRINSIQSMTAFLSHASNNLISN